jgi:hypothetical protein
MLQTRSLLYQQAELTTLERELNKIDSEEKVQLYLSSRSHDQNERRKAVFDEIQNRLREYSKHPLSQFPGRNEVF